MARTSLRRRLLTALVGLAMVPVLLVGLVLAWRAYQDSVEAARARQHEVARRVAVQVESLLDASLGRLESALRDSDFVLADRPRQRQVLGRLLAQRHVFREVAYLDPAGTAGIHLSNARLLDPDQVMPEAYLQAARGAGVQGRVLFGAIRIDADNNEPHMLLSVPVRALRDQAVIGVVVAELRFKPIWRLFAGLDLAPGEDVYLVEADGRVIAHRNPSIVLRATRVALRDGPGQTGLGGGEAIVASQAFELGGQHFRVVAERAVGQSLAPAITGLLISAGVIALTLVGVFALGVPLARRISRPVLALAETARAIGAGDLDRRAEVGSDDEIGDLAGAFNGMTERVRETVRALEAEVAERTAAQAELDSHRHHLEELVGQRTAELRQQQAFMQAVLDNMSDGIVACDGNGILSLFNRATRELHGVDVAYLPPEQWATYYRLFHEDGVTPLAKEDIPLYRAYQGQPVSNQEYVIERRDGVKMNILSFGQAMVDDHGARIGAVVTLHDITEQKRVSAELRQAKEAAEAANRAKSVFLANMSHELRTPLNAILGFAQIMARDSSLQASHGRELETIDRAGRHLLSLINDVLEISRIEAGRTTLRNAPFALSDVLVAIEEMVRVRADAKELALVVERHGDLPGHVLGDAHLLRQVLINLLGNAVKYTERGTVRLAVWRDGDRIRFEVSDTGPGIAPEDCERVFEAFYQTEVGIRTGEGTGLGLTISREFVRLMGGELRLASRPGEGSTFVFSLPLPAVSALDRESDTSAGRVIGLEAGQPAYRILVAEDNPDNRELIRRLLEGVGFQVRLAEDGAAAIEQFQSWRPHFIWMDMRMPGLDGYQATRRIRALPGGTAIPVAALTASAFQEDRDSILAAGCDEPSRPPSASPQRQAVSDIQAAAADTRSQSLIRLDTLSP